MQDLVDSALRIPKDVKNGTMIPHGDDSSVLANFSDEYIQNEFLTAQQGKPAYDHMIQVTLEYPGNNLNTFAYRFTPESGDGGNEWTERFPKQWEAFRNQKEQVPDGSPIELWPPLDKRRVMQLKSIRIHTVEQLASLTDTTGPNIGLDWRKLRDMATATLKPEVGAAQVSKLSRDNDDLRNRLEVAERQLANMAQSQTPQISQATTEQQPKKRGPKPKTLSDAAAA